MRGLILAVPVLLVAAALLILPEPALDAMRRILRRWAGLAKHDVQVDDHRWAYLDGGRGEVILFVHGYGMEKDGWDVFAKAWSRSHRLILPDLPGFGETTRLESSDYDIPRQAARLDRFVNTLGLPAFHLAGISMGGAVAAYYAGEHPDRVKSLFLMAPAGVRSREPSAVWRRYEENGHILLLYRNVEEFDALLDALFYRKPFLPKPFRRHFAQKGAREYRFREKILRDLEKHGLDVLEDRLRHIQPPTLVIWGENDQLLHVSGAEKFQHGLQNGRILILKECGHVVFFDRPGAARRAYRDFLQTLDRRDDESRGQGV